MANNEQRLSRVEKQTDELIEFKGATNENIKSIFYILKEIKENDIHSLNKKINWLLFSILGSVFITVLIIGIKYLLNNSITP